MMRLAAPCSVWALTIAMTAGGDSTPLFTEHGAKSFLELERAQAQIDPENVDQELLSAAIFHETNSRRTAKGLTPLADDARVRQAADMQAKSLAKRRVVAHFDPNRPEKRTPSDRLHSVGLTPAFAAENVALSHARNYQPGKPFYTREEDGRTVYSYTPGGESLPMLSYVGFAAKLLDEWMASPAHRQNILAAEPKFVGAAARRAARQGAMDEWYAAQVFFTPLPGR